MSTFLSTSTWLNENQILPKIKLRNRPSTAIGDWHYKLGSWFFILFFVQKQGCDVKFDEKDWEC